MSEQIDEDQFELGLDDAPARLGELVEQDRAGLLPDGISPEQQFRRERRRLSEEKARVVDSALTDHLRRWLDDRTGTEDIDTVRAISRLLNDMFLTTREQDEVRLSSLRAMQAPSDGERRALAAAIFAQQAGGASLDVWLAVVHEVGLIVLPDALISLARFDHAAPLMLLEEVGPKDEARRALDLVLPGLVPIYGSWGLLAANMLAILPSYDPDGRLAALIEGVFAQWERNYIDGGPLGRSRSPFKAPQARQALDDSLEEMKASASRRTLFRVRR